MRIPNAEVGVDLQMKIDVILKAGFAGVTLFDSAGPGDLKGDVADGAEFVVVGHGVHQLHSGFADDLGAQKTDDEAHYNASEVIGFGEAHGVVKGKAEGDKSDRAG